MIAALIPSLLPALTNIVSRFLPEDKEERAKAEREIESQLASHLAKVDLAQMAINREEAKSRNIFVAGWRPFIGWTCGISLAWTYVGIPIAHFALAQTGQLHVVLPTMDMSEMMPVLLGMLGLGGLRTFEKFKGVSK
tara:strand:+ start:540 stop:950 length:411 start_codon:yes stop_codon:yes gene_type:complete